MVHQAQTCECAIKMSYQIHYDNGKKDKSINVSRNQSYHGCTTQSLSIGDRPNLYFYKNLNKNVRKLVSITLLGIKKKMRQWKIMPLDHLKNLKIKF